MARATHRPPTVDVSYPTLSLLHSPARVRTYYVVSGVSEGYVVHDIARRPYMIARVRAGEEAAKAIVIFWLEQVSQVSMKLGGYSNSARRLRPSNRASPCFFGRRFERCSYNATTLTLSPTIFLNRGLNRASPCPYTPICAQLT